MAFTVNTNEGAMLALQQLNKTNASLSKVQTAINTGKKVSSAKDNSAVFAIAQKLRADVSGINAAKGSIDRALSTIDVSIAAGEAISDLLIEMKEKAVSSKDQGLDTSSRSSLNQDFTQLRDQITSIVTTAEFNGTNAVDGGTDNIIAITNHDASNSLSITNQDLTLGGTNISISSTSVINTQSAADVAVTALESSLSNVNTALSVLGAGAKRIELQKTFIGRLSDSIEIGIGNLVDADMAKVSAKLQSLQVKQQLGIQALSIANQAPQSIMSLFQ